MGHCNLIPDDCRYLPAFSITTVPSERSQQEWLRNWNWWNEEPALPSYKSVFARPASWIVHRHASVFSLLILWAMSLCRFNGEVALFFSPACTHFWREAQLETSPVTQTIVCIVSAFRNRCISALCVNESRECQGTWGQRAGWRAGQVPWPGVEPWTFRLCAYSAAPEAQCSLLTCSRHEKQICLSILCCKHVNSYFFADVLRQHQIWEF